MTASAAVPDRHGADLAVAESGPGGRPLLLVHGFTGAKEDFADWMDPLARAGWWVLAPDLRGHGASPKPDDEAAYSLGRFVDDLVGLVDRTGWSTFSLLGHSMGGMVAQELALSVPGRVERLVLMDTHHGGLEEVDPATAEVGAGIVREHGIPRLADMLDELGAERPPADLRVRAARPGYEAWNRSKLEACSPAMYASMVVEMAGRPDRLGDLSTLTVPTLVVVGEQDRPFLAASRRMADAIPGAQLAVVPDAAHSPQFENPGAWWAAVTGFLHG